MNEPIPQIQEFQNELNAVLKKYNYALEPKIVINAVALAPLPEPSEVVIDGEVIEEVKESND